MAAMRSVLLLLSQDVSSKSKPKTKFSVVMIRFVLMNDISNCFSVAKVLQNFVEKRNKKGYYKLFEIFMVDNQ